MIGARHLASPVPYSLDSWTCYPYSAYLDRPILHQVGQLRVLREDTKTAVGSTNTWQLTHPQDLLTFRFVQIFHSC